MNVMAKKREDRFEKTTTKNIIPALKRKQKICLPGFRVVSLLDNAPNYVPSWLHYPKEMI